jgi:hypothetical protein
MIMIIIASIGAFIGLCIMGLIVMDVYRRGNRG